MDLQLAHVLQRDHDEAVIFRQVGIGGREPQVGYLAGELDPVATEHPEMGHGGCVSIYSFNPRAFYPRYGHTNNNGAVRRASRRKAADVSRLN